MKSSNSKLKVLIWIDWFKPGYKAGGPITSNINLVEHLSDKIEFFVITRNTDYQSVDAYQGIQCGEWIHIDDCHLFYVDHKSLSFSSLFKAAKLSKCDTWYINGVYSTYFSVIPLLIAKLLKPRKVIISPRGMLSPHALAIKNKVKSLLLGVLRSFRMYKNVIFHATNNQEAIDIQNALKNNPFVLNIPNLPRLLPESALFSNKNENKLKLVSFARVSREKNLMFALQVLSKCTALIEFDIYGEISSSEYWKSCQEIIKTMPDNIKVFYRGAVNPNMIKSIYECHDALFLPTLGENYGHSIIESLMYSRPVIISDQTPWKQLEFIGVGWDISLNDEWKYVNCLNFLATLDRESYNSYCCRAYEFAKQVCVCAENIENYVKLFND